MPKLLIVDDDEFIRAGLRQIIDWEELGIEIAGEAEGGREALRLYEQLSPHIVLTDIRMPDGDGLFLMERIREFGWSTHLIVLSGYDDFTYLRQAMKFQVEDYLLKPVDAGELEQIARNCCSQIENRWMTEQIRKESFHLLRNNVLQRWVEHRIEDEQLREKLDFLQIPYHKNMLCVVAVISWKDIREADLSEAESSFRPFSILNVLEEMMATDNRGIAFLNDEKKVVCLFISTGKDGERLLQDTAAWLRDAGRTISSLLKTPWYAALGAWAEGASSVHHSYRDALRTLDMIEHTGAPVCVTRSDLAALLPESTAALSDHRELPGALLAGRRDVWEAAFAQDFLWAYHQAQPSSAVKYVAAEWMATAKETLRQLRCGQDIAPHTERWFPRIFAESDVPAIRQSVFDLLEELAGFIESQRDRPRHSLIDQAQQHIIEHYRSELTLQLLADRLHVSSIYLGRLFKAETGEYFSDFLNRLRLEEAKTLLRDTPMKASDIALKIGYSDSNYFFRKFKQSVGLSPTDYRNLHAR
ncbi:response regulator [Paenibacillus sp.]|uniref:response regulator n=1 Tax=Paenibacillus sp. TaxID=58172 RepID=UPI002811FDC5|nr:response regulator [Paenibacillus sp.]